MIPVLLGFFGLRKAGLIALAVAVGVALLAIAAGVAAWKVQGWRIDAARAETAAAVADAAIYREAAQRNARTIKVIEAAQERLAAANAADIARLTREKKELADIAAEIINVTAPNEDCGPRFTRFLERVRAQQAAGR